VNGKTRGLIKVPRGSDQEAVVQRAIREPSIKRFLDGKPIQRVVFVKDRLLNLVIG